NPFTADDQMVVGTADYVAPEIAHQRGATAASDVYSLGASLFAVMSGVPPFTGKSITEVLHRHIQDDPPDVKQLVPSCPSGIAALIRGAMAKTADERPSAETFAAVLQSEVAAALATDLEEPNRAQPPPATSSAFSEGGPTI